MDENQLLKVPEVAQRLSMSERYVWDLVRDGKIASVRLGNARRIPLDAVNAFVARLRGEAAMPA